MQVNAYNNPLVRWAKLRGALGRSRESERVERREREEDAIGSRASVRTPRVWAGQEGEGKELAEFEVE